MYKIIDNRTGQIVSVHSTLKQAHRKADRLDLQYGAVRYIVRPMNATITFTPKETP